MDTILELITLPRIMVGIGGILFIIQLCYLYGVYNRIHRACKQQGDHTCSNDELPPLSVVIVIKDAGDMLKENLTSILEQDYPTFEVIVVNEQPNGTDEDTLKLLASHYKNLYHTFIPTTARYVSRKKLGVSMGIKASRYPWIVVTEPYCKPASTKWLRSMAAHFTPQTDIVLGYSNYQHAEGLFAHRIQADGIFCAMRYLGRALKGHPYMGIGQNLAYRKECYEHHRSFAEQINLLRGEDDLFVNDTGTNGNTRVCLSPDGFMQLPVPPYKRIWFGEKLNLLVTGHYYKGCARLLNAIESWTCALFHLITAAALVCCILEQAWIETGIAALLWIVRFIAQMQVFRNTARDLQAAQCCFFIFYDLVRPLWSLQLQVKYWLRNKSDFLRRQ